MAFSIYLYGLLGMILLASTTWLVSIPMRNVAIVDIAWSLLFLAATVVYSVYTVEMQLHAWLVLILVVIWALRLSIYLFLRNWGKAEDKRYQVIREKYSPNFAIKSLGIIFIFQAVLAWIISLPLFAAISTTTPGYLAIDVLATALCAFGIAFETIADAQLALFKRNRSNKGKVMASGLWRYTRHPNYFGECVIWWGFYLFALNTGAWWAIVSPVIMTWLLLKFSGVVMLEETIVERRPGYRAYIETTNAFIPGPPKRASSL